MSNFTESMDVGVPHVGVPHNQNVDNWDINKLPLIFYVIVCLFLCLFCFVCLFVIQMILETLQHYRIHGWLKKSSTITKIIRSNLT
jgi:hypothetical protein